MPTYDIAKQQIMVTDNEGHLRRYSKGIPVDWRHHRDAVIQVPLGRIKWKSKTIEDGMQADKLPQSIVVAEDHGGLEVDWLDFEWVLQE
jgi:hypothetical protein